MVVVEVRQGTLGVGGRGWGPAESTVDRGSQLSKDDEDDEDDKDDKDDKEDEEEEERRTRQEEAEEEEQEEEEEEATDIKSNNPHLAGGEQLGSRHFYSFSGLWHMVMCPDLCLKRWQDSSVKDSEGRIGTVYIWTHMHGTYSLSGGFRDE